MSRCSGNYFVRTKIIIRPTCPGVRECVCRTNCDDVNYGIYLLYEISVNTPYYDVGTGDGRFDRGKLYLSKQTTGERTPSLRIGYYIGLDSTDHSVHGRFKFLFVYMHNCAHHIVYIYIYCTFVVVVVTSRPGDKKKTYIIKYEI